MPFRFCGALSLILVVSCGEVEEEPTFSCLPTSDTDISFEMENMPCVQISIDENDFTELGAQNRFGGPHEEQLERAIGHILSSCTEPFPDPFSYFPADVRIDGLAVDLVGVRKKGFVGSVLIGSDKRPSLKIKADKYIEEQQVGDVERITLNNNLTDSSRMRTCLVYSVFHDADYPAPLCNLANVMVNGTSLGAYTHVEPIKKAFLRRAFGNDYGSLYESTVSDVTKEHLADGLGRWEAKTNDSIEEPILLLEIAQALEASNEMLESELGRVLDIDQFLTFWALETIVAHGDGYNSNSNNSYVYFNPENENRAIFIPWGPDDAMQDDEEQRFVNSALARRLSQHPTFLSLYLERLSILLETSWNEERLYQRIDILREQIESAEDYPDFSTDVDELQEWIKGRRTTIQALIDSGGDVGEELENSCVPGLIPEDLLEVGEVVGTASISCTTQRSPISFILPVLVVMLMRFQQQQNKDTQKRSVSIEENL